MYNSEVVHFGIFERDKPPEAKLIASSIEEFESKDIEKTRLSNHYTEKRYR